MAMGPPPHPRCYFPDRPGQARLRPPLELPLSANPPARNDHCAPGHTCRRSRRAPPSGPAARPASSSGPVMPAVSPVSPGGPRHASRQPRQPRRPCHASRQPRQPPRPGPSAPAAPSRQPSALLCGASAGPSCPAPPCCPRSPEPARYRAPTGTPGLPGPGRARSAGHPRTRSQSDPKNRLQNCQQLTRSGRSRAANGTPLLLLYRDSRPVPRLPPGPATPARPRQYRPAPCFHWAPILLPGPASTARPANTSRPRISDPVGLIRLGRPVSGLGSDRVDAPWVRLSQSELPPGVAACG